MTSSQENQNRGYVALMAAILISAVLLVLSVEVTLAGYHARFNILGTEAKEQASALAQGCADQALSAVVTNPSYTGSTTLVTDAGTCTIYAVQYNVPAAGFVTIKTQAVVRGSYANMLMQMNMHDIHIDSIPNPPNKGTLVVITNAINTGNGTKRASDFTMNVAATNPSQSTFSGNDGGVPVTMSPGAYAVTESAMNGYATTVSTNCSGSIAAGEIKFCTVSNNDITTTLTILVNVTNDNGGTKTYSDFPVTIDGGNAIANYRTDLSVGAHTVGISGLTGYSASTWGYQCTGGAANGTVSLNAGDNKTCVINLNDNAPPAPSCADTVMILDRTGSMSSTDLGNEKTAANALVNLYASVLPPATPPRMGAGSIGAYPNQSLPAGAAGIPTLGQLSTIYANLTTVIGQMMGSNSGVGSDLSAGITAANNELNGSRHVAGNKKVIVLVSDGDPNAPNGSVTGSSTLIANAETTSVNTTWNANTGTKVAAIAANDGDTTFIVPGVAAQTYKLAGAGVPVGATNISVTLHAIAKRGTGTTASLSLMAENGTTNVTDGGHALSSSYVDYTWTMATNPLGGAWTIGEINNWTTNFGVLNTSASGNTPRVTQLYAVVSYGVNNSGNALKAPTAATNPNQWTNPTRVSASDNSYVTDGTNGHQQAFNNFGFSIPAGSTITGIQVQTEAKVSGTASTVTTPTLYPSGQGSQSSWSGGTNVIDETGTPNCSSFDSVTTGTTNNRESTTLDLSNIPDGSTITNVTITSYDRPNNNSGGTYKTFTRVNGAITDAALALTAGNVTGGFTSCNSGKQQSFTTNITKDSNTSLEIGVIKISGNTNAVRVGALNATITYTPPTTGSLDVALSSNGGSSWTSVSRNVPLSTTENTISPNGNSISDLWGRGWTATDFNSNNFLLRVQNNAQNGMTTLLDYATVNVFYTTTSTSSSASLFPSTAGVFNGWPSTGGTALTTVVSNDGDTSYIDSIPSALGAQAFIFPNAGVPSNATNISVTLHAVSKETVGSNGNIKLLAEQASSGQQVMDAGHTLSGTYTDYTYTMNNNPFGGAWTPAEVNAWTTRFGVRDASTIGTTPRVSNMYLALSYTVITDPIAAAQNASDVAKRGPDGIVGTADDTDIFTIHFGDDPGPYAGKKLLANLASGTSTVSGHENGSVADANSVVSADTGYLVPTVATSTQWTGASNAFASDNVYATDAINGHTQAYTGFGLAVPPTSSVAGVAVEIEAKSSDSSGCQVGADISWDGGASYTTAGLVANVTGSDVVYTLGSAATLWGRTWTSNDFSNGNFVVRLKDIDPGNNCNNGSTLSVDRVSARAYYTTNLENGDGDNFFISPNSTDMKDIFTFIGTQVCPAVSFVNSAPPPTTASLTIITQVINNNGGAALPSAATLRITGNSPSANTLVGSSAGTTITLGSGNYSVTGDPMTGYAQISSASCNSSDAGNIAVGETRVCVITYDDIPPPPPAPNLNINLGNWQEVPTVVP